MKKNKELSAFYDKVYRKGEKKHYTKLLFGKKQTLPIDEAAVAKSVSWKGKTVLDVGCGTGLMAFETARRGAKKVVGVDFSPEAIRAAKETYRLPNLEYRVENVARHKGRYDIIMSLGTLEHMDNPLATLRLLKRRLAKNGAIVITSPNWSNPRGYILQTLRFLFDAPITLADLHYFTPLEFTEFAKKINMRLEWKTFDQDWAQGPKLLKDFARRLPNVLRDMKITGKEKETAAFLSWIERHILPLEKPTKWNGATGLYVFRKTIKSK
ncbi:methyltransferase domain-containing protein [Patescibacteria group bacterium]|nr:methyltransferase domain-containing protein [Patescibacteria group bacterium]